MLQHGRTGGDGRGRYNGPEGDVEGRRSGRSLQHTMKKRTAIVGLVAGLALAGAGVFFWNGTASQRASAQGPRGGERLVPVSVAKATKQQVPVRLEALGTVTTIASVAIKTRVDSEITAVKFEDGARVKQGDVLFVLDSRAIETEIRRVQAVIVGAEAQFEQASRDVQRY